MFGWALVLLILAVVLVAWGRRTRARTRLPVGEIVYADTARWDRLARPLFSARLQLSGKPDYVVRQGGAIIPVEVKSRRAPSHGPNDSHVFQLAAYCLLVQDRFGVRPKHGLIQYGDETYKVDFTPDLESQVLELLHEMRIAETKPDVSRSHEQAVRCLGCGFGDVCAQSLAGAAT